MKQGRPGLTRLMMFRVVLTGFRQQARLQTEIIALRHQLTVLQRTPYPKRLLLNRTDRCFWVWLSRFWSGWRSALIIVKPETVIGWHRRGFQWYWTWKIRHGRPGRPKVPRETRELIRTMSRENVIWGAPRICSELLKLGIQISEASVAKYMVRHHKPPSQTWRTFLQNHISQLGSIDFFTVHTIWVQVLFVFVVLAHNRREALKAAHERGIVHRDLNRVRFSYAFRILNPFLTMRGGQSKTACP